MKEVDGSLVKATYAEVMLAAINWLSAAGLSLENDSFDSARQELSMAKSLVDRAIASLPGDNPN